MTSQQFGAYAETLFIAGALERGWTVFLPNFNTPNVDLVVDPGNGRLVRVQVKAASFRRRASGRPCYRVFIRRHQLIGRRVVKRRYPPKSYDVLAVFCADIREWRFFPETYARAVGSISVCPGSRARRGRNGHDWSIFTKI